MANKKKPLNKDRLVLGRKSSGGKDWFVLGRECLDCIKERILGLVYLCDYDDETGEAGSMVRFDSYDKAFAYIEDVLGETPDEDIVAVLLSEAKTHACKHSLEKAPPGFFEGKILS
jgi:hypothetical protein